MIIKLPILIPKLCQIPTPLMRIRRKPNPWAIAGKQREAGYLVWKAREAPIEVKKMISPMKWLNL